jgi:hypothetical protein
MSQQMNNKQTGKFNEQNNKDSPTINNLNVVIKNENINSASNININNNILVINKISPTNKILIKNKKRLDYFNNEIKKNGKQKITFLDKINNKKKLVDTIQIESYKAFNIMDEPSSNSNKNSCCIIL